MEKANLYRRRVRRLVCLKGGAMCTDDIRPANPVGPGYSRIRHTRDPPSYVSRKLPSANPFHVDKEQKFFPTPPSKKYHPGPFTIPDPRIQTICDIDDTFFTLVEGRPLKPPSDTKVYMANIRDIAMCRANIAFLIDRVICLHDAETTERNIFQAAEKLYNATKENFSHFLRDGYMIARVYQSKAKHLADLVIEQTDKYEAQTFKFVELRSIVSSVRVECEILANYRKFVNRISPNWWRELHDEDYKAELASYRARVFPSVFFPRFDVEETEDEDQLEMVVNPVLHFSDPQEMIDLFTDIQNQCLTYLQADTHMASIIKTVLESRDRLKLEFEQQVHYLQELNSTLELIVQTAEDLALELKHKCEKVVEEKVLELACSRDAIMLETYVEYAHEKLLGVTLGRREVVAMATAIQGCYLAVADELDLLDTKVVKAAEKQYFAEEARAMKMAFRARAELVQWQNMTRALHAAFEPAPPCPRGWAVRARKLRQRQQSQMTIVKGTLPLQAG